MRELAERFDLYRAALLQTDVTELTWDDDAQRWTVHTDRGDAADRPGVGREFSNPAGRPSG